MYVIEWGRPSRLDVSLDFGDHVDRFIDNCVDVVRERTGADDVHLFGYSTSVPPVVMYAARYPEKVATLEEADDEELLADDPTSEEE